MSVGVNDDKELEEIIEELQSQVESLQDRIEELEARDEEPPMAVTKKREKKKSKADDSTEESGTIRLDWSRSSAPDAHLLLPEEKTWALGKDNLFETIRKVREVTVLGAQAEGGNGGATESYRDGSVESLYREIDALLERKRRMEERETETASLQEKINKKLSELRALQHREAEEMRQNFEDSLNMPIDAGREALERADELLNRYEDTSGDD